MDTVYGRRSDILIGSEFFGITSGLVTLFIRDFNAVGVGSSGLDVSEVNIMRSCKVRFTLGARVRIIAFFKVGYESIGWDMRILG